ncbi:hypothetical protein PoB_006825000 [Plakobranchus ocellatus]|uniref:Uncharacterized protein n=1 Tax=Plakobranchus ocellatus TaxID=259542 RepID=A0AAV4DCS2_9GAST|nr:hypothetical protein PoB_006825000 [Plakobranchus ocellatus]
MLEDQFEASGPERVNAIQMIKSVVFLAVVLVEALAVNLVPEWIAFKSAHSKVYKSPAEEAYSAAGHNCCTSASSTTGQFMNFSIVQGQAVELHNSRTISLYKDEQYAWTIHELFHCTKASSRAGQFMNYSIVQRQAVGLDNS